jgi:hypothetical protein
MGIRSKTEIIVETHRILTIKRGSRRWLAWCEECDRQAQMVTADEAAILCRVSSRAIYQLIETGELHFRETPDGGTLICADSLMKHESNEK